MANTKSSAKKRSARDVAARRKSDSDGISAMLNKKPAKKTAKKAN